MQQSTQNEFLTEVRISTEPPVVFHGTAQTMDAAHDLASLNVLRALAGCPPEEANRVVAQNRSMVQGIGINSQWENMKPWQNSSLKSMTTKQTSRKTSLIWLGALLFLWYLLSDYCFVLLLFDIFTKRYHNSLPIVLIKQNKIICKWVYLWCQTYPPPQKKYIYHKENKRSIVEKALIFSAGGVVGVLAWLIQK